MNALRLPLAGSCSGDSSPDSAGLNGLDDAVEGRVECGQPLSGANRANRLGPEFGPESRPEFGPEWRRDNRAYGELLPLVQTVVQSRVEVRVQGLGARCSLPPPKRRPSRSVGCSASPWVMPHQGPFREVT
jgi:hypothetical protein